MKRRKKPLVGDTANAMMQATVDHLCASIERLPSKASRKRVLMHLHEMRPEWDIPIQAVMGVSGLVHE